MMKNLLGILISVLSFTILWGISDANENRMLSGEIDDR